MYTLRKADERGKTNMGWLNSAHTFSFGHYYDPRHLGFGCLRVLNDDRVIPGAGFRTHGHHDMEIISYVLRGLLEHKDSMGNGSIIRPGDVLRMSAGSGVMHSEFNHSQTEPLHFLQIWFFPEEQDIPPEYEQKSFDPDWKNGALRLVASNEGRDGSVSLYQDVNMYVGCFDGSQTDCYHQVAGRQSWLHVARGCLEAGGQHLSEGDGLAFHGEGALELKHGHNAEVILMDMTAQN
ncbi:MAG: pirin family protein [Acidobacteriota bacterium]|nr:pirin family protein [Acidobacteriota bacterium]